MYEVPSSLLPFKAGVAFSAGLPAHPLALSLRQVGMDLGGRCRGLFSSLLTQMTPTPHVRVPSEGLPETHVGSSSNPRCDLAPWTPILSGQTRWRFRFPSRALWEPRGHGPRRSAFPPRALSSASRRSVLVLGRCFRGCLWSGLRAQGRSGAWRSAPRASSP